MTKLRSFLYLLIIFLTISSLSYGEENPKKWYTGIIQPTALELQQAGDSLHIQILYNFDNIQVSSNHSIELIPVLIAANHQMELPEISVKGRKNYQNLKRKLALMNTQERAFYQSEAPYSILKGYGMTGKEQIRYSLIIPFEPWMKDAYLNVRKEVMGCCRPGRLLISYSSFWCCYFGENSPSLIKSLHILVTYSQKLNQSKVVRCHVKHFWTLSYQKPILNRTI